MPRVLTPEQVASYEREGYLFPFDAFPAEKAEAFYRPCAISRMRSARIR